MFAQVACVECGKPFQVPKAKVGETVTCSWCGNPTAAVPLAMDALPLPAGPKRRNPLAWVAYAAALVAVSVGVFLGLRGFGDGNTLRLFTAPDGSCAALLPGSPREVAVPDDDFLKGGKRFVAEPGWFGGPRGEVGWFDMPDAKQWRAEDLFVVLRDRRAGELGATAEDEKAVRVDALFGREVRYTSGNTRHTERYLFDAKSTRPRVYWVSVGGDKFDPDSPAASKVLGSLRVTPP